MRQNSKLSKEARLSFRDQLREARSKAEKDAEAFEEIVFVLERLGTLLNPNAAGLGQKRPSIIAVASESLFFSELPDVWRELHTPFAKLYDLVKRARNDAMHEGNAARYATDRAIELCLVLEDALMNGYDKASDFMVRNVVCAEMWQPLCFIRQAMLANSFSCLPVRVCAGGKTAWHLISDKAVARYLRVRAYGKPAMNILVQPLQEAITGDCGIQLAVAQTCLPTATVADVLKKWDAPDGKSGENAHTILVSREGTEELLGILTPYRPAMSWVPVRR